MALTLNKFQPFVNDLTIKIHNLATDQLVVALTDATPTATNHVLADITQISYANCSSRNITTSSSSQTGGTYNLKLSNLTLTASGGNIAQFRYIVVYNSTAASGNLVAWFDTGVENNIVSGANYLISFDSVNGLISIT